MKPNPPILLVDNGSLAPASVLSLRRITDQLGQRLKRSVNPAGLLHVEKIKPEALGGSPALRCETQIKQLLEKGISEIWIQPFFIGPSLAITDYLPSRLDAIRRAYPDSRFRLGTPLVPEAGEINAIEAIVQLLARQVGGALPPGAHPEETGVLVCDHGSPLPGVAAVRNQVTEGLRRKLPQFALMRACSMERRPGPEYAFNDPLLEVLLKDPAIQACPFKVIAMLFLLPGRHAGPEGDVAQIAREACPEGNYAMTQPLGFNSGILDILETKIEELSSLPER